MAAPTTSPGRFWPWGPLGIAAVDSGYQALARGDASFQRSYPLVAHVQEGAFSIGRLELTRRLRRDQSRTVAGNLLREPSPACFVDLIHGRRIALAQAGRHACQAG